MKNNTKFLEFGMKFLDQTRDYILEQIKIGFEQELKPDESFVTTVDRRAEKIMREAIRKEFPDHGIIGEEHGVINEGAEYIWYLDPIDGTAQFVEGLPQYGTLCSLYHHDTPIVGLIDHPSLNLRLSASKGNGAYINGKKFTIKDAKISSKITDEVIAIGPRFMFEKHGDQDFYDTLISHKNVIDDIQNCHWHTRLLQGEFGALVDYGLRSWDISPVKILVEEAGGKFVEMKNEIIDGKDRHAIIFGKPKVVDWILGLIAK